MHTWLLQQLNVFLTAHHCLHRKLTSLVFTPTTTQQQSPIVGHIQSHWQHQPRHVCIRLEISAEDNAQKPAQSVFELIRHGMLTVGRRRVSPELLLHQCHEL